MIPQSGPLSVEGLRNWFSYEPDSGIIRWRKKPNRNTRVGDEAGYLWRESKQSKTDYIRICVESKTIFAHVVAWVCQTGTYPVGLIDHQNGAGTDNRWTNLRDVSHKVNLRNQRLNMRNRSGVMGVDLVRNSRWRARIIVDKKEHPLGCYADRFDAICARKSAEHRFGFHQNHGRRI